MEEDIVDAFPKDVDWYESCKEKRERAWSGKPWIEAFNH